MWVNRDRRASLVRMYSGARSENSIAGPQEVKRKTATWLSYSTARYVPKRIESRDSNRYLYTNVYNSIIHSNQRWKQFRCPSTDEWINKCGIDIQWNIIPSKKCNVDICWNMDGSEKHYAKWNKPDTREQMLYDFTCMWYLEQVNLKIPQVD